MPSYMRQPELNEVIFSGGDPLMAKDDEIHWLLEHITGDQKRCKLNGDDKLVSLIQTPIVFVLHFSREVFVLYFNYPLY